MSIPALEPFPESVQAFLTAVAGSLANDEISASTAKELNNCASKMLTSISVRSGLREMDELRELVRRSQVLADERKEEQVKKRYAQGKVKVVTFPASAIPKKNIDRKDPPA